MTLTNGDLQSWKNRTMTEIEDIRRQLLALKDELRKEVDRVKNWKVQCRKCGHEMTEVDGKYGCDHCDHEYEDTCDCEKCSEIRETQGLQSQIATLTRERDEARERRDRYETLLQDATETLKGILATKRAEGLIKINPDSVLSVINNNLEIQVAELNSLLLSLPEIGNGFTLYPPRKPDEEWIANRIGSLQVVSGDSAKTVLKKLLESMRRREC